MADLTLKVTKISPWSNGNGSTLRLTKYTQGALGTGQKSFYFQDNNPEPVLVMDQEITINTDDYNVFERDVVMGEGDEEVTRTLTYIEAK